MRLSGNHRSKPSPKTARNRAIYSIAGKYKNQCNINGLSVAVLAVWCKPVSVFDFPVFSEFTGNFAFSALIPGLVTKISQQQQMLARQFPTLLIGKFWQFAGAKRPGTGKSTRRSLPLSGNALSLSGKRLSLSGMRLS
jgi:hypothetical protein